MLATLQSQFHYGSIKTDFLNKNINLYKNLNSTMVRLKLNLLTKKGIKMNRSQFHYGSIKTVRITPIQKKYMKSLNSTMVRLKHFLGLCTFISRKLVSIPLWFD